MSDSHESWLSKQGARVVGRHVVRKASLPRFTMQDEPIDWAPLTTTTENVLQVEINEATVDRLKYNEDMLHRAMSYVQKPMYNSPNMGQYFVDKHTRHLELLKENPMYRDAWKEFQSIRALLGEDPYWP